METVSAQTRVEVSRKKLTTGIAIFVYKIYVNDDDKITFWFIDICGFSIGLHLPARLMNYLVDQTTSGDASKVDEAYLDPPFSMSQREFNAYIDDLGKRHTGD